MPRRSASAGDSDHRPASRLTEEETHSFVKELHEGLGARRTAQISRSNYSHAHPSITAFTTDATQMSKTTGGFANKTARQAARPLHEAA